MSVKIILILFTLLSPASLFSQWEFTGGPEGGGGYGIIRHGPMIFAATINGVYRSSDMGDSWTKAGLDRKLVFRLLSVGTSLYAAVDNILYVTTDNGNTWKETFTTGTAVWVHSLVLHKNEIYLSVYQNDGGSEYGGVYKSADGGTVWTRMTTGDNSSDVRALLSVDFYLIAVTRSHGIFRTNNGGTTWTQATIDHSTTPLIWTARSDNGRIYAAGEGALFLTSADYGKNWDVISAGNIQSYETFYDVQFAGNKFYAIMMVSDTLYISTNNGTSWQPDLSADLPHNAYGYSSKFALSHVDNRIFCQMDIGTFSTPVSTLDWKYSGGGIVNANSNSLAVHDGTIFAGSLGGPFRSSDNGVTWIMPEDSAHLKWRSTTVRSAGNRLYAFGEEGVWQHTPTAWTEIAKDFTYDLTSQGDTIAWAAGYEGVRYTTDGGTTIHNGNGTGTGALPAVTLHVDRIFSTGTAYIAQTGFNEQKLYRSTDGMQTWHVVTPTFIGDVHRFLKVGTTIYAGMNGEGLHRSLDDGLSWERMASISASTFVEAIYEVNGILFISTFADEVLPDGVYRSFDGGISWASVAEPLDGASAFVAHNDNLYASSYGAGVWKRSLAELDAPVPLTDEATMLLYPNPCYGKVIITCDAEKLILHSPLGAIVWEGTAYAGQEIVLPVLPAGMYLVEIIGPDTHHFEKLLLQ